MDSLNEDILVLRLDELFLIEKTLNLFVAYHCVLYFDFVDDSSNIHRNIFEFLDEALLKQYEFGRSWLFPGDVVIVYLKKDFQN